MSKDIRLKIQTLLQTAELKRIFSAIESSLSQPSCTVLAVTSASSGEGKTTIVSGLAAHAAAHHGQRVLAIDLNWHAPGLHTFFGLDLTAYEKFNNGASFDQLVQKTEINNLHVLCAAGASAENSLLQLPNNSALKTLINKAREDYTLVLIDTSRVFPLNRHMIDPIEVAKNSDGAILVVLTNKTPRQTVKKTKYVLETAGVNMLGIIVNQSQNPLV